MCCLGDDWLPGFFGYVFNSGAGWPGRSDFTVSGASAVVVGGVGGCL